MANGTLEEFLESKRKDGSQQKYEASLQPYDIANAYVSHAIENYLKDLNTHNKNKYIEIFDILDYAPRPIINTKKFESVYAKIYEGVSKEDEIFTRLWDIARARIVCRTLDQIGFLKDYFVNDHLIAKKGLRLDSMKDYTEKPTLGGYRGVNYNLIIPKDILQVSHDIRYELQLTTEMQHTWTELSHILVYKNRKLDRNEIKFTQKQMTRISEIIFAIDEMYEDLREEVKRKTKTL